MIERGQVRGYTVVPRALRAAFARVADERAAETRALKQALGISVDDESPPRRHTATRKRSASVKKRAARR